KRICATRARRRPPRETPYSERSNRDKNAGLAALVKIPPRRSFPARYTHLRRRLAIRKSHARPAVASTRPLSQEGAAMLVLARQRDESVMIGDDVEVKVVDIRADKVRLGFVAPAN